MVTHLPFIQVLIFLSNFIEVSVASELTVNFTRTPKDADYFVGSEAILRWEYPSHIHEALRHIKFGIQVDVDVAILVKDVHGKAVQFNNMARRDVTASFIGRVSVLENETASFRIKNLTLNDTGKYFCNLETADVEKAASRYVQVTVVDIIIDRQNSTLLMESWVGHKISLICAVTKASPGSTVDFYWRRSDGSQVIGKQVYWKGKPVPWKDESQMTIVTSVDRDFEPVTCIAKSNTSTQRVEIIIKQLYKPREPVNVTAYDIPSNDTECPLYSRLTWEPPEDDGGTPLTGYIVEYKHPVFNRVFISKTVTRCTEHVICKLQSEYPREVHVDVRAINKIGRGFRSRTVPVSFFSSPSAPLNLTSSLVRKERPPFDVWISWSPPEEDGGAPVVRYSLEYKELGSAWIYATELITNNTYMSVSKTDESYIYEVRVTARNEFGLEKASKIVTVYFGEKPDQPQDLVKKEVFYDQQNKPNIKVVWKPPKYDGGVAISHYIIEHKTVKTEWSTAANSTVKDTEYSFQVEKSETYTVRTRAVNKLGVGKSAVITVKFTAEDVKTLARLNNSTSSTTSASFGVIVLLTLSYALA